MLCPKTFWDGWKSIFASCENEKKLVFCENLHSQSQDIQLLSCKIILQYSQYTNMKQRNPMLFNSVQ